VTHLRILTKQQLDQALDALCALDPRMAKLRAEAPEPPLRTLSPDLAGLVWIVNSQLISVTAARAIHGRVEVALGVLDHATLSTAPDEVFRVAGMSGGKLKTIRALCGAVDCGLDIAGLATLEEEDARARLVESRASVPGPQTSSCCSRMEGLTRSPAATSRCRRR
jgi:DNA-3-methyladenine glycosylase II